MIESEDLTEMENKILQLCRNINENQNIIGACIYGSRVGGYARPDSDYDVLLILSDYPEGIRYYYPNTADLHVAFLLVDRELFEMDVNVGSLGDFVAGRLLSPYLPIIGQPYLRECEVKLKNRVLTEELRNLVIQYDELSRGLAIPIEYIVLSRMKKRMKVYPPLKYCYFNLLQEKLHERNLNLIASGYKEASREIEEKGLIKIKEKYITLTDRFIDDVLKRKNIEKVINILDSSRRALYSYIAHGRAGRVNLDIWRKSLHPK